MGATFTAQYEGQCAECGDAIEPGDGAGYIDDEVCCGPCVDAENDNERGFGGLL